MGKMSLDTKLSIAKGIAGALALGALLTGCSQPRAPEQEPAGVIDLVPGQQSVIQPPQKGAPQAPGVAERPI